VGALVIETKNSVFLTEVWMLIEGALTILTNKNFVSVAALWVLSERRSTAVTNKEPCFLRLSVDVE
jgi:hypothetical protein